MNWWIVKICISLKEIRIVNMKNEEEEFWIIKELFFFFHAENGRRVPRWSGGLEDLKKGQPWFRGGGPPALSLERTRDTRGPQKWFSNTSVS